MDVIYGLCCLLGRPRLLVDVGGLVAAGGEELLLAAGGLVAAGAETVCLAGLPGLLVTVCVFEVDTLGEAGGDTPAEAFAACLVLGENLAL
jgi:hypothetical protein